MIGLTLQQQFFIWPYYEKYNKKYNNYFRK